MYVSADIQLYRPCNCHPYSLRDRDQCSRRDKDNIAFAKKFIQDSLVHAGVLQNDGWKHIEHFTDDFAVDPKNPRVEVVIEEFEGGNKK